MEDPSWLDNIMKSVNQLITDVDDIAEMASLASNINTNELKAMLPKIQDFMTNGGPHKIVNE